STFLCFVMMLEGMKRIGAVRAAILSMLGPVLTIVLGTGLLGERLEPVQWAGCAVVLAAVTTAEMRKIRGKVGSEPGFAATGRRRNDNPLSSRGN
ncbi:MAG: DMT family transporter, partial [Kyrpidia sp.]|nr:DMT family transporter [Kyrpidia sp.]